MPFFESIAEALARGIVIQKLPPPSELTRLVGVVKQRRGGRAGWIVLIDGGFGSICSYAKDASFMAAAPKIGSRVSFRIAWAAGNRRAVDLRKEK